MENMEHDTHRSYPVVLMAPRPERPSRWLAFATLLFVIPKFIILIPHIIILYFLGILAVVVGAYAQLVVLLTGTYPVGPYKTIRGVLQWKVRFASFLFGLTDEYPPFSFD